MTTAAGGRAEPFDVCGPLPGPGVTLLEASAGTGKTFTIASLAARYLAEGLPVESLLVVTFTRAATSELRERVRRRLVEVSAALSRSSAGLGVAGDDVVALIASGSGSEIAARRAAVEQSLRRFDQATIATTHGFCEQMLAALGLAGEPLYDVSFSEDLGDLADETADDLVVRRAARNRALPIDSSEARRIVRCAVAEPDVGLEPSGELVAGEEDAVRVGLAQRARAVYESRKAARSVIGYDDLQRRLLHALSHESGGDAARRRLAGRFQVVLVDEFQDTDPVQWAVLEAAFASSGATLVLIGDPKQAIYSFRGADVFTYLKAAGRATRRGGLTVNWRSDAGLLAGFDALFDGAQLGHAGITYHAVRAASGHGAARLRGAEHPEPLRFRVVRRAGFRLNQGDSSIPATELRLAVVADLVADLAGLLGSRAVIDDGDGTPHPVCPGDVAVLVHKNKDALSIRDALGAAGVPAVMLGTDSVYQSPAAASWLDLLEALDAPGDRSRVAKVALGELVGWNAELLAEAGEDHWAELSELLHRYDAALREGGVAALYATALRAGDVPGRLLGGSDGERAMTDLAHVAQLLHAAAIEQQLGERALTGWLRRRIAAVAEEGNAEGLSRRLERDVDAVQVVTVHRSKGLEFPIVYAPYLFVPPVVQRDGPFVYHDPEQSEARVLEVGRRTKSSETHRRLYAAEQRDEALRLAYVALTRARHQVVLWWAPMHSGGQSPLARLLFSRGEGGELAGVAKLGSDEATLALLGELAGRAPRGAISVEVAEPAAPAAAPAAALGAARAVPGEPGELRTACFGRGIDRSWRRTSYSGLVAASHGDPAGADPGPAEAVEDEQSQLLPPAPAGRAAPGQPLPLGDLPGGVEFGTFVHHLLEKVDFAARPLEAELRERVEATPGRERFAPGERAALARGLAAALSTPLGPVASDLSLCELGRADRLDELEFELALAGGDAPRGELELADVADLLDAHLDPGDPLAAYPERLRDPTLAGSFRGYLTGSIDLVARREGTYFLADYKTNRLARPGEQLSTWHYRQQALAEEMMSAHYPLQALLYAVALHRYLRWRVRGYEPGQHLRGVAYLFVRGMVGADAPREQGLPCGVFTWSPPATLIEDLSALLEGGRPVAAVRR